MMVKCKACGKRYDYKEHGCCPECGAYNRPPQRNRVDVDGTVHHMSDADFLENREARRRSQGEKVCFEQDVCYEDQARTVRSGSKSWEDHLNEGVAWLQKQSKKRQKGKGGSKKPVITGIVILVLFSALPTILSTCIRVVNNIDSGLENVFTDTVTVKPEQITYASEEADLMEPFQWWGAETMVVEASIDPEAETNHVMVVVEGDDVWDMPMLYYKLSDGTLVCHPCDVVEEMVAGRAHKYYYQAPDMYETAGCYLEFAGYHGDEYCTTTVWLT